MQLDQAPTRNPEFTARAGCADGKLVKKCPDSKTPCRQYCHARSASAPLASIEVAVTEVLSKLNCPGRSATLLIVSLLSISRALPPIRWKQNHQETLRKFWCVRLLSTRRSPQADEGSCLAGAHVDLEH